MIQIIRCINAIFAVEDEQYYWPVTGGGKNLFKPALFARMTNEPFPNEVFIMDNHHTAIQWVNEHTEGRWAFDGSWESFWVIRFESAAEAVKMRMTYKGSTFRPETEELVSIGDWPERNLAEVLMSRGVETPEVLFG